MKRLMSAFILCVILISSFGTTSFAASTSGEMILESLSAEYGIDIKFATEEEKAEIGFTAQPSARNAGIDEAKLRQAIEANIRANQEAEAIMSNLSDYDWEFFDLAPGQNKVTVNDGGLSARATDYFEKAWSPTPSGGWACVYLTRSGTMITSVDGIGYITPAAYEGTYHFMPSTIGYSRVDGGRSVNVSGSGRMYYVQNGQLINLSASSRSATLP